MSPEDQKLIRDMAIDVAIIRERTATLAALEQRVSALEVWKAKQVGWLAGAGAVGAVAGWVLERAKHLVGAALVVATVLAFTA